MCVSADSIDKKNSVNVHVITLHCTDCLDILLYRVGSKIIRALSIILAVFLWFDCHFLSSDACCKQHKD